MKTPEWKDKIIHNDDEFTYKLSFLADHLNPKSHFLNDCGWTEEEYREINSFYWFTAKISAHKGSVCCGASYLGGNCYKNLKEVLGNDLDTLLAGYGPQLVEEAKQNALTNLNDNT